MGHVEWQRLKVELEELVDWKLKFLMSCDDKNKRARDRSQ